ncbi:hypothetical protein B0T26DRAFT_859922 [Lasiosphaeria miniovina]|uniref:Uncharacterized protein n=1 Tax=Lasiosphaeria miniovina TaxID=1954250 RepID=A0AA40A4R9_9PEZI|nr:uncharacterized protein B0T26DRAFT_859922 [Lasiosphaeria miniovina]KAK0709262.1 hypothetical protein B0T26DRAFT_859922 [Lasiosphaeria miniovina]
MKAVFVFLCTLAASAMATPLVSERQLESQGDELDKLTSTIRGYTANINKTTAAAPSNPTLADQTAAGAALGPDLQGITNALTAATALLSKRDFVLARTACGSDCLLLKVKILVWEIAFTLKVVIVKLGLGCVLVYLTPLLLSLVGLLKCLDKVVAGLLFAIKGLLTEILGAVAGGVLALIF